MDNLAYIDDRNIKIKTLNLYILYNNIHIKAIKNVSFVQQYVK